MKVLVVGGGGMIGQSIVKEHIKNGDDVYVHDLRLNKYIDYSSMVGINLSDEILSEGMSNVMDTMKFDIISDQAAYVSVGESQVRIGKYMENNIAHTADLLESILESGHTPEMIMLAGSMGPYGEGARSCLTCGEIFHLINPRTTITIPCPYCDAVSGPVPIKETSLLMPKSVYGISKMTQENLVELFGRTHGVPVVSLRYFSVYSLDSNPNNPLTGVLSIIANKYLNSDTIVMNEDGSQTRDLIRNTECARAHFLATRKDKITSRVLKLNIATGVSHSIREIADEFMRNVPDPKMVVYNNEVRVGDIKDSLAYVNEAGRTMGFYAPNTVMEDIKTYCEYILANRERFTGKDTCAEADKILEKHQLFK